MIGLVVLSLLVAVGGSPVPSPAASLATPSPTTSAAIPTPVATVSAKPPILAGVTLGERASGVLLREGVHSQGPTGGGFEFAFWRAEVQDIYIGMVFDQQVRLVVVRGSSDPHGHCADPYGIRLGDTLEHLVTVRGRPDDVHDVDVGGDQAIVYGPAKGVHWVFVIVGDTIVEISVADGTQ